MNIFKKSFLSSFHMMYKIGVNIDPVPTPKILVKHSELIEVLNKKKLKTILFITGPTIYKLGLPSEMIETLQKAGFDVKIFNETIADPTIEVVEKALKFYLDNKCEAIIAFGGGSPIDTAKIVAAKVARPRKDINKMTGLMKICRRTPLLITVPTTSGTGTEATMVSIIKNSQSKKKFLIMDLNIIPKYAYLDEKLTINLPPKITAQTGMDALTHAVESYLGKSNSSKTKKLSLTAIKLIMENLETAYKDGKNLVARKNMLYASFYAGQAFTRAGLGYVHGIAHSIGGYYGVAHGLANAVLLPKCLEYYGDSIHKKLAVLSDLINLSNDNDTDKEKAEKFINKVYELNKNIDIPTTFNCIEKNHIPKLAKRAYKESIPFYPVPKYMTPKELEKIYLEVI